MKTIYEKLLEYFETSESSKVQEDWESVSMYDKAESPNVEDFVQNSVYFSGLAQYPPDFEEQNFVNILENPNFTSDFFLI